jgi:hypothetical protein
MRSIVDIWLGRTPPAHPTAWHRWSTFLPVRLENGKRSNGFGQLWRRQGEDGRWYFKQDPETDEHYDGRQY